MDKLHEEIKIRNIIREDFYEVECLTKRSFWNINMPGCDEHYLVHKLLRDDDFINELSLVAIENGKIIGAILYAKASIESNGGKIDSLIFGPLCVEPSYQNRGIGKKLLLKSMDRARELNYKSIFICGIPTYYPKFGFITADKLGVSMSDCGNFDAFMGI